MCSKKEKKKTLRCCVIDTPDVSNSTPIKRQWLSDLVAQGLIQQLQGEKEKTLADTFTLPLRRDSNESKVVSLAAVSLGADLLFFPPSL